MLIKSVLITFTFLQLSSAKFDDFTLNLYKTISKSNADKNLMISPASVASALGLVMHGTSGNTRAEIERVLVESHEFGRLMSQISRDATIESANKIFLSQQFSVKEDYQKVVKRIYESSVERVNFGESEKTAGIINGWVSEKTRGLIDNIVEANSLSSSDRAILVNAMLFNATWVNQFVFQPNKKLNFRLLNGGTTIVPPMEVGGFFDYAYLPDEELKVIELDYRQTNIKMIILLPDKVDGLSKLEENLTPVKLNDILSRLRTRQVEITMPKFKIETDIQLKENFREIGITKIFNPSAEFDSLTEERGMFFSEIFHKTFIDVNERGTIAAAVTGIRFATSAPGEVIDFTINRPFLFLIKNDDFTFFVGRVVQPEY